MVLDDDDSGSSSEIDEDDDVINMLNGFTLTHSNKDTWALVKTQRGNDKLASFPGQNLKLRSHRDIAEIEVRNH
jgi:hypothetical protein